MRKVIALSLAALAVTACGKPKATRASADNTVRQHKLGECPQINGNFADSKNARHTKKIVAATDDKGVYSLNDTGNVWTINAKAQGIAQSSLRYLGVCNKSGITIDVAAGNTQIMRMNYSWNANGQMTVAIKSYSPSAGKSETTVYDPK